MSQGHDPVEIRSTRELGLKSKRSKSVTPSPRRQGRCEKIENRLLPALSVRRGTAVPRARATLVERALRARFRLWIRRRDGSGLAQLNFFTASGCQGSRAGGGIRNAATL